MTDLKINTYPMHIGDWHSGTSRMSLAERGAYITLCNQYYLDQGDGWTTAECVRLCGAISREEQKAVKTVLASKFEQTSEGYSHVGMDRRIADIQAASERNQERARRAANARHQGRGKHVSEHATSNATSTPEAVLEDCDPKAKSQKPKGESISNETLSPERASDFSQFDDFRRLYPIGRGADAAERAWEAALDAGHDPAAIISGLHAAKSHWQREQTPSRYIPLASNWLSLDKPGWLTHGASPTKPLPKWPGPQALREAVADECGEEFAVSYLDPATWQKEPERIIAATQYAAEKLRTVTRLKTYKIIARKEAEAA
jgi:uncharacterized protein YdaU (DUF1376 family)